MGLYCSGILLESIVARKNYRNGIQIGKDENYYSPGHPSLIKNYNDSGQEEGLWQEWWPNGNKKLVAQCHKGLIISDEEYFPNGNLRLKEQATREEDPSKGNQRLIFSESFSPTGKATGKVINGTGELWTFSAEPDSTLKRYRVEQEIFKNGLRVHNAQADAKTVEKLLQ